MTKNEDLSNEKFDPVSKPEHYAKGSLECIDWIRAALTPEEYRGYLKGCILKYHWRHEDKGNPIQDLEKLRQYAQFLIDEIEREEIDRDIQDENMRIAKWLEGRLKDRCDETPCPCSNLSADGIEAFEMQLAQPLNIDKISKQQGVS